MVEAGRVEETLSYNVQRNSWPILQNRWAYGTCIYDVSTTLWPEHTYFAEFRDNKILQADFDSYDLITCIRLLLV